MARQFVVGVDIGGQTSKIGVVDARGEVLAQSVIRTDTFGEDANAYIDALADAVKEGKVKPTDNIMLNVTGGGMLNATKKGFHLKEADLVLSPDLPAEEIIAKVNKLFK